MKGPTMDHKLIGCLVLLRAVLVVAISLVGGPLWAAEEEINNGQDPTKPLTRLDFRYQYQNLLPDDNDNAHIVTPRAEVNAEQRRLGLPELVMGIGINMGVVIVGNIGSEQRTKYGAMGSAINTAYRIESYTVSGQILISPELYARVHDMVDVQETIEGQFKGVEQPLTLYDICGMVGPYQVALRDKPQEVLTPLSDPLAMTCYRMHGKAVSAVGMAGQMMAVGLSSATAALDGEVAVHDNLKVLLERPDHT